LCLARLTFVVAADGIFKAGAVVGAALFGLAWLAFVVAADGLGNVRAVVGASLLGFA